MMGDKYIRDKESSGVVEDIVVNPKIHDMLRDISCVNSSLPKMLIEAYVLGYMDGTRQLHGLSKLK